LIASKVELEDDDRLDDDDNEVEVKGMLNYDTASGTWFVKDIALTFDGGTEYEPLSLESMLADQSAAGLYVEVEGEHVGDVLQVEEIELEEDEFDAFLRRRAGHGGRHREQRNHVPRRRCRPVDRLRLDKRA
jgi:hypothetical protein